jgi:hypothetical protein
MSVDMLLMLYLILNLQLKEFVKLRLNLNITILHFISTHAPADGKDKVDKEEWYSSLEKVCDVVLNYDMKTLLGDFKAKVGKEAHLYPARGGHSLHNDNDNGKEWYILHWEEIELWQGMIPT